MLRGTETAEAGRAAQQRWALPAAPPSAPAPAAGGGVRLVVIPDAATTVVRALGTLITDGGGALVSGRRSFGGQNKAVEAEARRALGDSEGAPTAAGESDILRREGGEGRGKKRGLDGGGGGGGGGGKQPRRLR